ncbi:MAG: alpha/beta hydrolase, partial [Spirochaetia bacterium]|nr:alpha/beta hydrolase [Spirochaetia bacterium]
MSFSYQSIYFDEPIQKGRVLDIFTPKKINRDISLFFIHGGGWRAGSRADYHNLMRAFNEEGHVCAATDYRLQGVNLSEQLTDVRRGYDLFLTALRRMGRPERVVVYGGSAGALLAALVSMNGPSGWTTPVGVALSAFTPLFTPWEDIFPGIWSSMQDIAGAPYD